MSVPRGGARMWLLAAIVTAAVCLAGCSSSGTDASASSGTSAPAAGAHDAASQGYPITVDARYGEVTIDEAPGRIVALTVPAADSLIALGVEPAAVAAN